ncbi:MAG: TIGR02452 family protein [Ruminococcus sp.]|nr:TIGR02452 family protein [Ruminococcus sp.]
MGYLKIKLENDKIFRNGSFPEMKSEVFTDFKEIRGGRNNFSIKENTVKQTTVGCILSYAENYDVLALNFANAMYAGGGYVLGGNAQEESLCRGSLLYYTIKNQKEYYRRNRLHILPDYTDTLIYSENVPIIRDDRGVLLEKPLSCGFITIPAVNRSFARFMFSDKKINLRMQRRIDMILGTAAEKNPDVLVLGAFGCGMFGNKREVVLDMFEKSINAGFPENIKIVFAIPD